MMKIFFYNHVKLKQGYVNGIPSIYFNDLLSTFRLSKEHSYVPFKRITIEYHAIEVGISHCIMGSYEKISKLIFSYLDGKSFSFKQFNSIKERLMIFDVIKKPAVWLFERRYCFLLTRCILVAQWKSAKFRK